MKVLLDVHIRFFSKLLVGSVFMLVGTVAYTQGNALSKEDKDIAHMAKTLREQSRDWQIPVNQHQEAAKAQAAQLFSELQKTNSEKLQLPEKQKPGGRVIFFASHSLGQEGLDELLYSAATTPESLVVFRGIRDEKNFARSVMEIQKLASKQVPMANVAIDPTLFRDYRVNKVPTILYLDNDRAKEVARVEGLSSPSWMIAKIDAGKTGDFGIRGPVEDIQERDLIEVMKEKVAAIDWAEKKEQAIEQFWDRQQFLELPKATKARTRSIDPSILVTDDITDAAGKVIVPKGTKINPLRIKPFTQAVLVFDPLDPKQMELVDKRLAEINKEFSRVTLIVTRFDRADGWQSYKSITNHFNTPVYKLTQDISSRFQLEYSPSVITAKADHFVIEELSASEDTP